MRRSNGVRIYAWVALAVGFGCVAATASETGAEMPSETPSETNAVAAASFERTEVRENCARFEPLRQPLFGDLHVHTRYSFDSYTSGQRNGPDEAYRYAKGDAITLPDVDGEPTVEAKIDRPLDFTSVTDHSEFLGEMHLCTEDAWSMGYWTPLCVLTRADSFYLQLFAAGEWVELGVLDESETKERSVACSLPGGDCEAGASVFWEKLQEAAEAHYDRSAECRFTTFVGYEYTDAPGFRNLHRNVIFRNEQVIPLPISTYDTGTRNFPELWRQLRAQCIEGAPGCDVLSIPHNPNLAGGLMFPDPKDETEANDRRFFEPLVELVQHKAASECRFDRLAGRGVGTEDELCTFEQNKTDNLAALSTLFGELQTEEGKAVAIDDYARRNMVRNVLVDGLALEQRQGVNPFQMGFIGSTDTHSAVPGGAMEYDYVGHLGRRDTGYRNVQDHFQDNPGGLAVVWAEENSRDSVFAAMRRRETYATSGTRPVVRFFGGYDLGKDLCDDPDRVAAAYASGVPMGGNLPAAPETGAPRFLVSALKDPGVASHPGTDLQRIQIIKGWVDAEGQPRERVIDVAGSADNGAGVDASCRPTGLGHASLCSVWEDPDFDPAHPAVYYARVLENPTCRWSTLQCQAAGVNPFAEDCAEQAAAATAAVQRAGGRGDVYGSCCLDPAEEPFYSPVIQERAWTSPIWTTPPAR
ncbi:MAG: DUF3604 domain-containing protein [Myxococcota bacterium]